VIDSDETWPRFKVKRAMAAGFRGSHNLCHMVNKLCLQPHHICVHLHTGRLHYRGLHGYSAPHHTQAGKWVTQ
jgi:hypothetical protein